jgi:AraC-like DNA-binding protein
MCLGPLIRLYWVHPFLELFREDGAPVARCLTEARLPPEVDQNLELAFPAPPLYGVIDRLVRESGLHDVGLTIGGRTRIWSLGPFGHQVVGQATLGDAIAKARELMPSVHAARRLHLSTAGDIACLSSWLKPGQLASTPWDDQFTLSLLIDLVRRAAGSCWLPEQAAIQARLPRRRPNAPGLDGIVLRDGGGATAIQFPRSLLSCPLASAGTRVLDRAAERRPDLDLDALPTDFVGCVQVTLDTLVASGRTEMRTLADVVGSSVRTLSRRLADHGWTFRELLDHSRFSLARRRLVDTSVKVTDIAFEAGYSDSAHFTRAFRRWTGQSPVAYRSARSAEAA